MEQFSKSINGQKLDIRGIIPPMVTPFDEQTEEIRVDLIQKEAEYLISTGVPGICVSGSTGEGHGMSEKDIYTLCKATSEQLNGRGQVIGGVIADTTEEAIRKGLAAKEGGATSLQVTPPHYLWVPTVEGLVQHFQRVGEAVELPLLIYNVIPWVDIDVYDMSTIIDEAPWVLGVKQSGGDMHKIADMMAIIHDRVPITTGIDDLLYSNFALGVDGAVSCLTAVFPEITIELQKHVLAGDHVAAKAIHDRLLPIWRAIEGQNMTAKAKYVLNKMGREVGISRSPILAPNAAERALLDQRLAEGNFIK